MINNDCYSIKYFKCTRTEIQEIVECSLEMGKVAGDEGVNQRFPNWFEHHSREKVALNKANQVKVSIIPAFVALAQVYKIEIESLSKKIRMQDQTQLERYANILQQALHNFRDQEWEEDIIGIHAKLDFKTEKWSVIFEECEICAVAILQATINYLEQSSTVGQTDQEIEHELCAHFFMNTVDSALRTFLHNVRKMKWLSFVGHLRYISQFGILRSVAVYLVSRLENICPLNNSYNNSLRTAMLDLMEAEIEKERQIKNNVHSQDLISENRCYGVLDGARKVVTIFITRCLQSLTATLFHFCVAKSSLTIRDRIDLEDSKTIIKSVEEDVNAAGNMFTLISEGKMRPFGFVMKATLEDSLPKDKVKASVTHEIRLNLLECISIYMNWRFNFVTRYPRPIQSQFSRLSRVSNLFQSMIESADDMIVILKVSKRLHEVVEQRLKEGKVAEGSTGPWCLLAELEKYFHPQLLEYEVKLKNRGLPAQIEIGAPKESYKFIKLNI